MEGQSHSVYFLDNALRMPEQQSFGFSNRRQFRLRENAEMRNLVPSWLLNP